MLTLLKIVQFKLRLVFLLPGKIPLIIIHIYAEFLAFLARNIKLSKIVQANMALLLPENIATQQNAKSLINNFSYSIFELLSLPYFRNEHFAAISQITGQEKIKAALAAGKGAILITIHAGNYEIVPTLIARLGYPINTILKAGGPIFAVLNRSRQVGGVKIINVLEKDMFAESLKALKQNELIGTLADTGALDSRHVMYKFLGKEVPIATGWLTLAQRAECAVLPVVCRKDKGQNYVTFYDPLFVNSANREDCMAKVSHIFEEFISNHPDQWAIFFNSYETKRMVEGNNSPHLILPKGRASSPY